MTKGFPEDQFSGAYDNVDEGDPNDAASFGAHNYSALPTAALIEGCTFTVDYTNNVVDIASGAVRLVAQNVSGADNTTWEDVALFYELSSATGLGLTDGATNHVYVEADLSSPDTANFVINTTGSAPSGPSVKLGQIDTTATQAKSEQWNLLASDGTLTYPNKAAADAASASLPAGTVVYDRAKDEHHIPRVHTDTITVTSNYTTSDEDIVYVDSSAGAITVTLASADVYNGSEIVIVDSGGNASTNKITVDTGGTETIDAASSATIDSDSSALSVASDGNNWFTAGSGGGGEFRVARGEDGILSGKTLESSDGMTVKSDESFVVSDSYTVDGTLDVNGSMTVI